MRLVVVMVHVFLEGRRTHFHELAFTIMLSQVAHHQTLRRICVDINEIGQHTVGSEYN